MGYLVLVCICILFAGLWVGELAEAKRLRREVSVLQARVRAVKELRDDSRKHYESKFEGLKYDLRALYYKNFGFDSDLDEADDE